MPGEMLQIKYRELTEDKQEMTCQQGKFLLNSYQLATSLDSEARVFISIHTKENMYSI